MSNWSKGTTLHVSLSVRGALGWPDSKLYGLFRDETTGLYVLPAEARELLMDELARGVEMLPLGQCEGHDPKTGCPGHKSGGGA